MMDTRSSRNSTRAAWTTVARQQLGVLTRDQALAAGMTERMIRTQLARGWWERAGRSVFRVLAAPESWEQRVWVACLETGGVASHRTAGWLWKLDGLGRSAPSEIEVMVEYRSNRTCASAHVRRSRTLLPAHLSKRTGPPRTHLARTLLDLSEVLDAVSLELAFDSALRSQADLRHWLNRLLKPLSTRGHPGIANLRALLAEKSTAVDSALEVRLRRLLKTARLPAPRTGVDVVDGGMHVAKLDFAWPGNRPRVALMAHGARWHGNTRRWKRDLAQTSQLSALGWRVVQCSMEDVEQRPDELLRTLRRALSGFEARATVGTVVEH